MNGVSSQRRAVNRHGVERHDPPAGARFDPSLHEAMFTAPLSDGAAPGTVRRSRDVAEMQPRRSRDGADGAGEEGSEEEACKPPPSWRAVRGGLRWAGRQIVSR